MKKSHLLWITGCALLITFETVRADDITYTCPPYTALTAATVPGQAGVSTYTGNLVGGTTPALQIGTWITADLPPVNGFSQARFEARGPNGTPVLHCWYSGTEFGVVSPMAVNGRANLPTDKTCKMTGSVDARGNCRNADPTKCPVVCSD